MRLRLLIEVESGDLLRDEIVTAIESGETLCVEMPGWGSAVDGTLVGAVPVDDQQALSGHSPVPPFTV